MKARYINANQTIVQAEIDGVVFDIPLDSSGEMPGKLQAWMDEGNNPDLFVPPPVVDPGPSVEERLAAIYQRLAAIESAIKRG